ncbi:interleukin-6 receptor subunit beta-like [Haliotis rufescens]|uniref:interleukin-6 receptor subunit beta-like n=1 Tax=Haliotis rufescens TaxID=6454 RepID=UPI00201EAE19|nr:interleukin-6 receptor subunit beta-like [Haliotis rufescens]
MTGDAGSRGTLRAVILLVAFSYSLAFFFNNGEVRPINPNGFINETLTLNCTVTSDSIPGNVSGSLFFVKDFEDVEKVLPMQYITPLGDRAIQLDFPIMSDIHQGSYVCKLNKTDGSSIIIGSQYVSVDYRTKKVEKIDCRVFDWRNMTCTWDLGVDYINENRVIVELQWAILESPSVCPHQTMTSCSWKENDAEDSYKPETYFMRVNVTRYDNDKFVNIIDEALSNYTIVDTLTLVEPAPVYSLTVANRTSMCLSLRWNHGQQFMRRMMYTMHVLQKQGSVLKFNTSEREVTVCDLHPARTYKLQVSCIPLQYQSNETEGFYSDWTSIEAETLEDVPSGVPGTQIGSFVYSDCNQTQICTVTIYWKPIPLEESNGKITLYKIQQKDTQNGTRDVAGSATSYDLLVGKDREYSITLRGGTQVGMSGESNPIVIPAYNKVSHPSDIMVEADSSTLYITWGVPPGSQDPHQGRVTGYTLYYCNGSKITSKCLDSIHWFPFPPGVFGYELKVPDGNLDNKIIGVSVEKEVANQTVSSGFKWSSCVYQRNRIPLAPQSVNFTQGQPDNALNVEWKRLDCVQDPVYITHYVLSYCAVHQHGGCKGASMQVNVSNRKESQVIQGLSAGVKYRVTLRAVSRAGDGPESEAITRVVVNSDLTGGSIAGIAIGAIFGCIVILSLVICCIRKVRRTYKNLPMDIKLPTLVQVDDDRQVSDKENNNNKDLRKETPISTKKNKTDTSRSISRLKGILNPKSNLRSEDICEKPVKDLEIVQQKPLCNQVKIPCSGESTDSECDKSKTSLSDSTGVLSSLEDSYLKLGLSGNSDSARQDAGSNYITRDKLSLLLGKTTPSPCDAPFDESSHSSGQDTASSPPPPYEPPPSPDDQKLETPPPTYSSYVSSSQADFSSASKEMFPSCTNSHPLSTLLEHQSSSSSPSDVPNDQTQPHGESSGPQGLNIAPKPQSETDSPYIPLDKVPPPPPPEEQKTVSPPADGYVSVSDASQMMMNKPGSEKPKDFCPTAESGNYCKIGINGSLSQLSNSDYISQTDLVNQTALSSNSSTVQEMTTTL